MLQRAQIYIYIIGGYRDDAAKGVTVLLHFTMSSSHEQFL